MYFSRKNVAASCCFIAIAVFFLVNVHTANDGYFSSDALHPMSYPRVLLWLWIFLSVLYAFARSAPPNITSLLHAAPVILSVAAASVCFVVVLPYLGFAVASALLMFAVFRLLRYGGWGLRLAASCCYSAGIWFIFQKVLSFPLTTGTLTGF